MVSMMLSFEICLIPHVPDLQVVPQPRHHGCLSLYVMEHFGGGTIVYYIIAQPPQVLFLYSHLYACVAYFLAI